MPISSIEDSSLTESGGRNNSPSEHVSQPGVNVTKFRDNDLEYKTMFPRFDNHLHSSFNGGDGDSSMQMEDLYKDPYHDDAVLLDEPNSDYQAPLGKSVMSESFRRPYNQGSYSSFKRMTQDSYPYSENAPYGSLPARSSIDYSSNLGDRHTSSMSLTSPHPVSNQPGEYYEDGLFIETMPPITSGMYDNSYDNGNGDNYGESLLSPRTRSPAPFDRGQRRHNSYYREDDLTPELHSSFGNKSYSSLSIFRDGGVGVGRSYQQAPLNDDNWIRTQSVSGNMNSLGNTGFSANPYSRASYNSLRSSSLSHSHQQISEMGLSTSEYGDMNYHGDLYSSRLGPNRVSSMERIPDYYNNNRGYGTSLLDTYRDRDSDLPMSRARSMMYLGDESNLDSFYPSSFNPVSRGSSYQNISGLGPDPLGDSLPTKRVSPSVLSTEEKPTTPIVTGTPVNSPVTPASSPEKAPEPELVIEKEPRPVTPPETKHPTKRSSTPVRQKSPPPENTKSSGVEWRQRRSQSPVPRETSKSPRPLDDDKKHNKYKFPCRDFENGVCLRGAACKFYHDPNKGTVFVIV